jgi:para-nitrobenzyl esterase
MTRRARTAAPDESARDGRPARVVAQMNATPRLAYALLTLFAVGCDDGGEAQERARPDASTPGQRSEDLEVTLEAGKLQGDLVGQSARFLRIPYAEPPLGELRWKAPVERRPWQGVRHESELAPACPQDMNVQGPRSDDEDCLYLNVWAPSPRPKKAAVMVWIHGGGNFAGSAGDKVPDPLAGADSPRWYDGQIFAEQQGVIVVTLNYRLGPFGFFSHPALAAEGSPKANQGLLDQKLALEWVRDNIEKFGGDPDNVTLFGESAGSADVCFHVVSPLSKGLFHRAISQSGGCVTSPLATPDSRVEDTAASMRAFASALGCTDEATVLDCLRAKSAGEVLDNGMQLDPTRGFFARPEWTFGAVIDGEGGFVPQPPHLLLSRGDFAKVPYLLGSNDDEGTLFTFSTRIADEAQYQTMVREAYGAHADAVLAAYPLDAFAGDFGAAWARILGDSSLVCGTHEVARRVAEAGVPVYMYNFNVPWTVGFGALGAAHSAEISHVFGKPYKGDADSQRVSDAINGYWASFAKGGDPNFEGAPATWPRFSPSATDEDERLQLDGEFAVLESFRKEECAMWRAVYEADRAK